MKPTYINRFSTLIAFTLFSIATWAFDVDGFSYTATSSTTVRLTKGPNQAEVIIPETITYNGVTYTVTEIAASAFYGYMNTRKVVIPGTVVTIGDDAFYDNYYLEEVEFNEGLQTIGAAAFQYNFALTEIRIPSSVTSIARHAFHTNQTNRATIICLASTPPSILSTTFQGRTDNLHVVATDVESYKEAENWKDFSNIIGDIEFANRCYAPTITFDNYLLTMSCQTEGAVIYYTTDGSIPDETSIRYTSPISYTKNVPIRAIAIAEGFEKSSVRSFNNNQDLLKVEATFEATLSDDLTMTITYNTPNIPGVPEATVFYRNDYDGGEWQEYIGPVRLTTPGEYSVYVGRDGWVGTEEKSFDFYTDYYTEEPTITWDSEEKKVSITHEDPDVDIYYTLDGTDPDRESTLYTEPIPISKNTEIRAFAVRKGKFDSDVAEYKISDIITRFYVNGIYYQLDGNMIDEVRVDDAKNASGNVVIPEIVTYSGVPLRVVQINGNVFKGNTDITTITLPNSIKAIEPNSFYECNKLTSITLGNQVNSIGTRAFQNCTSLQTISLPDRVQAIGDYAFCGCTSLSTIHLPEDLTSIGNCAFYGCSSLSSIQFPEEIRQIGNAAFWGCSKIKTINLPESVITIGTEAFRGCSSMTSITLPSTLTSIPALSLAETGLITIDIPSSVKTIGYSAFGNCHQLTSVCIPEGVTEIDHQTFDYCYALISVSLPSTLTNLGYDAFLNCTKLQDITLPANLSSMARRVFVGCSALKNIYSLSTTPPSMLESNVFDGLTQQATLHVPTSALQNYKNANYWAEFSNINPLEQLPCAAPELFLTEDYTLVMQTQTEGATIYYTTDGTEPSNLSTKYTVPIPYIRNGITVRAIAIREGNANSPVSEFNKVFKVATPVATISDDFVVTITCEEPDIPNLPEAHYSYTMKNRNYSWLSSDTWYDYNGPFHLNTPLYIRITAKRDGWNDSETVTFDFYSNYSKLSQPSVDYDSENKIVTISHSDADAIIYYTLDGTDPTTNSNLYTGPFNIDHYYVIKVIATKKGHMNSDIYSYNVPDFDTKFYVDGVYYQLLLPTTTGNEVEVTSGDYPDLADIVVPETITYKGTVYSVGRIGDNAFLGKGLNSIVLPNTIRSIGDGAFSLNGIAVQDALTQIDIPASVESIGIGAFLQRSKLETIILHKGLKKISSGAFGSSAVKRLDVPESITAIENATFFECHNLQQITLPSTIQSISPQAFQGCYSLSTITLPEQLKSIDGSSFNNCNALTSVYSLSPDPPTITSSITTSQFDNVASHATLYVKKSTISNYRNAQHWQEFSAIECIAEESACKTPTVAFSSQDYNITISTETEGAKIYYTDDGSIPTTESKLYTNPIPFVKNDTIKAIAVLEGTGSSEVVEFIKNDLKVATPVASLSDNLVMTITCESSEIEGMPETKIYYQKNKKNNNYEGFSNWILYEGPVQLTEPGHVKTTALRDGWINSDWGYADFYEGYVFDKPTVVEVPDKKAVVLKHTDNEAKIYYTLDGTKPTKESTLYEDTIHLSQNTVVTAIAAKNGYFDTDTICREFKWFTVSQPQISISKNIATITCEEPVGAQIYYTIDNTNPTTKSTKYEGEFVLKSNCNIKVLAVAENWNDAPVATYRYRVSEHTCQQPAYSQYAADANGNLHQTKDTVYITSYTEDAVIYYTTNGDVPTTQSAKYEGLVKLTGNCTVKAIAVRDDMLDSQVSELNVDWFKVETPQIEFEGKMCSITSETEGTTMFYTIDESEPTTKSLLYNGRFALPNQQTIVKALAVKEDWGNSDVRTRTYNPGGNTCETPVIARVVGTDSIQISTRTEGTTIYYTTNGLNPTPNDQLYEKPFVMSHNGTLKAIALHPLYYDSEVASTEVNWFKATQPVITVENKVVTITCSDADASIHYTLDGTDPTEQDMLYRDPITMTGSCTIKAITSKESFNNSTIAKIEFRASEHSCGTPVFTRNGNKVTLSATPEENTTIYYTLDESVPTNKSEAYTEPIEVTENMTIKAIATNPALFQSEVGTFEVNWFKAETPEIAFNGVNATITCATPGAAIYYTIDGTTPTEESPRYSKAVTLTASCTVKAIAMKENFKPSSVSALWFDRSEYLAPAPQFQRQDSTVIIIPSDVEGTMVYYTLDGGEPTIASTVYSEPIKMNGNCTLKVMVTQPDLFPSETAVYEVNWFKVESPVIEFDGTITNISCATPNARIYYTIDGSTPTEESLRYLKSFTMTTSGTVKAIALRENYNTSTVSSVAFDKAEHTAGSPLFQVVDSVLTITSESMEGTTIYYTTDGTEPNSVSNVYSEPFKLTGNCTLKAIATNPKLFTSEVSTLDINWFKVETPSITFNGTYTNISCSTPNAKIFYTLDGTTPTEESLRYMKSFAMTESGTIKAIALKENYISSTVASVSFDKDENTAETPLFQRADDLVTITCESGEGTVIYYTTDGTEPNAVSNVYSEPLALDGNCTLKAIAMNPLMFNSNIATYDVNWFKVETPVISFDGTVTNITCATPNARIYYTTDGSNPTEESTRYENSVKMTETCNVRAIAVRSNYINSSIASVAFNKDENTASTPLFQRTDSLVTITSESTLEGTVIYYTTDGTEPNITSEVYSEPLKMEGNCTLKAIAMNPKMFNSAVATYDVNWYKVETPVISFDGTITQITCATPNARIYYTTDGTNPTEESPRYENSLTMTETCTIKAIAAKANYNNSAIASVAFNKDENTASTPLFQRTDSLVAITSASTLEGTVIYYTTDGTEPNITSDVYREPIKTTGNCTLKAFAMNPKMFDSAVATYDVNWYKVETPVISFDGTITQITCATPNARIYYTTDGSNPTEESLRYDNAVTMTETCVVKAIAAKTNHNNSAIASVAFNKEENTASAPLFQRTDSLVAITSASTAEGTVIYYTMDGTEPNVASEIYKEPIKMSENCTLKAVAMNPKMFDSAISSYDVNWFSVETPVVTFDGIFATISCATPNSHIYYTTDGSVPTHESIGYTGMLTMTESCTLKAIAIRENFNNSSVATSSFNKGLNTTSKPVFQREDNWVTITSDTIYGTVIYYTLDGTEPTSSSTRYVEPIEMKENCTLKTMATNPKLFQSETASLDVNWFKVETPVVTFDGIFASIDCTTPNSRIYYTIDGTTPDESSLRYSGTLTMSSSCTLKAIAVKENFNNSTIVSELFDQAVNTVATPKMQRGGNKVTISSDSREGTLIYYTLDGTEPTTESTLYTEPIEMKENCTLMAIGSNPKLFTSEAATMDVSWFKVEKPQITMDGDMLTINCSTPGATIYYAYSEAPTTESSVYSAAIKLVDNREIQVMATKPNFHNSDVAVATPDLFVCEKVTFEYNGRYLQMSTNEGATIYYTTDGTRPTNLSAVYSAPIDMEEPCTVTAIARRQDFRDSQEATYAVTYVYNGEDVNMDEAGHLEEVFTWAGGTDNVETLPVKGKVNSKDISFIRSIGTLRHLDLKEATFEGDRLPDEAFANLPLVSFKSPSNISSVGEHLFKGCKDLAAIVWNANVAVPQSVIDDIKNPNMMLYVNSRIYAPNNYRGNLISGGEATNITLTDADSLSNFYCPERFYTQRISYTHNYTQTTKSGTTRGWETLALPFDVQTITHERRGAMAPFAKNEDVTQYKPFWLYELQETGFVKAEEIKAYTPYIVSMPNNENYADDYILAGNVTFAANGVYVEADTTHATMKGSVRFTPSMQHRKEGEGVFAINLEDCSDEDGTFHESGSAFLSGMRDVRPFEAFALVNSSYTKALLIGEYLWSDLTDIRDVEMKRLDDIGKHKGIFDLSGKKISDDSTIFKQKPIQHKKIMIINGQKTLINK